MNKIGKGFSLIELSIVILIIGILIAGVTQGSRLVRQSKIVMAQTQTNSSPVSSISGLALWLETTSTNSLLDSQIDDGSNITQWNDINPQNVNLNSVSRGTSNNNISYKLSGINGLPSIYFNGTTGVVNSLSGSAIITPNNNFTIFAVYQSYDNSSANWRVIINNGNVGSPQGFGYQKSNNNKRDVVFYGAADNNSSTAINTSPEIASMTFDSTNINLYINGTQEGLTTNTGSIKAASGSLFIGNKSDGINGPWLGLIAEIIVYDHALKPSERKSIEQYLGKKWGIVVIT